MLLPANKQPKHGARIRASELVDGVDRLHVVHTLTTGTGATAGAEASFSESSDNTIAFIRDTLSVPDSTARYAESARILFSDRARDLDRPDTWAVLPNMLCVASDPLRRCLEVESCFGGKKSPLSANLRRLHMKFSPIVAARGTDASSKRRSFYSRSRPCGASRLERSASEEAALRESRWTPSRCAAQIMQLECPEYVRSPFKSREEYVSMIMAFIHLPEYKGEMRRRHKK